MFNQKLKRDCGRARDAQGSPKAGARAIFVPQTLAQPQIYLYIYIYIFIYIYIRVCVRRAVIFASWEKGHGSNIGNHVSSWLVISYFSWPNAKP